MENDVDDLVTFLWFGPYQEQLGLDDELLVDHIRDVTAAAVGLAEGLAGCRAIAIDIDFVTAGALLHDVSHLGEFEGTEWSRRGRLLDHPHYGLYLVRSAGLPVDLEHVVLSHTTQTDVTPATLEAEIVNRADETTANSIRARVFDDLRDAPSAGQHE